MKCYDIKVSLRGTVRIEDPRCPSRWRNSGVYDIDSPVRAVAKVVIYHDDIEAVKKMLEEYDWPELGWSEVEDVEFGKVTETDCDAEEVDTLKDANICVIEQSEPENDGPDPDDYYEERRLRER